MFCCASVYNMENGFRLLPVPLGVHQPLHEILGTAGVQVFAVVAGECAL